MTVTRTSRVRNETRLNTSKFQRNMPRPRLGLVSWLLFGLTSLSIVAAHMIDLRAAQKECFFEDLHVNDKVSSLWIICTAPCSHNIPALWLADDRNISGWLWGTHGYRFLGMFANSSLHHF